MNKEGILKRIIVIIAVLWAGRSSAQVLPGYHDGLKSITDSEIMEHISFLASDSLKGRAAGSEENLTAALYVAGQFKKYGLRPVYTPKLFGSPAPDDSSPADPFRGTQESSPENSRQDNVSLTDFFQRFSIRRSKLGEQQTLSLSTSFKGGTVVKKYDYKNDFLIQQGGIPRSVSVNAPLAFVGFGIDAGEDGYNDYTDASGNEVDVTNKVVVIVDGFPQDGNPSSPFSKARKALYRNPLRKAEAAAKRGAIAMVVISSPLKHEPPFNIKYEKLARAFERTVDYLPERHSAAIPIFYVGSAVVEEFFSSPERLDSIIERINTTLTPTPFVLKEKTIAFDITVQSELLNTQNVVAVLEGTDPKLKDEWVVIGAHYDHIGLGYYGSLNKANAGKIHNGADDNASGTAGLLEVAEAFSQSPPKRSLLFIAFGAEENGLLGSRYYAYVQPLKPLEKTVTMLNCDMIGRNEPELVWIGGAYYSDDLRAAAEIANDSAQTGFSLLYNVGMLTSASDQAPFLRKEIPALFFFAGLHDDYHTPADIAAKINGGKSSRIAQLAYMTGWIVGNDGKRPQYRELTVPERAALIKTSKQRQDMIRLQEDKKLEESRSFNSDTVIPKQENHE